MAQSMRTEQTEDGRFEGAFQPRERQTDALVYQGAGSDEEGAGQRAHKNHQSNSKCNTVLQNIEDSQG